MKKRHPLRFFLVLAFLLFSPAFAAGSADEQEELLSMYFDESELVETATGSPKPIVQVAENVTIVTAEDITAMRAHTLDEVLERQSGVIVSYFGQDLLGSSDNFIHGSQERHVLVLLDGVRINVNSAGNAITNFIPVGIIKRIEIIKGAASSTWGSAQGGVINIITKDTGTETRPTGEVRASFGEAASRDISADAAGKFGKMSYYLHAGNIDTDGLRFDRFGERDSLYAKMQFQLPRSSRLSITGGYSDPYYKGLNWDNAWGINQLDIYEDIDHENIWATLFFDTELTHRLTLHLAGQYFENTYLIQRDSLGTGVGGAYGTFIHGEEWEDDFNSLTGRLTYTGDSYIANLGLETSHSEMVYSSESGPFFGGPTLAENDPVREDRFGIYTNLTYNRGKFSITPGIRYDHHSNSEDTLNPSLGITYLLADDTLLRGSIAKGFAAPYLNAINDYADLQPETVWTYQTGIETERIPYLHLKTTLFYHDIEDAWTEIAPWTNTAEQQLKGIEIEAKTSELYGFTLSGNYTYVAIASRPDTNDAWDNDDTSIANLIFSYLNDTYGLRAELAGHYYWMNKDVLGEDPADGTWIWDLLLAKDFTLATLEGEVYCKAHNLFNGDQYWDVDYANPERWIEVGIAFTY